MSGTNAKTDLQQFTLQELKQLQKENPDFSLENLLFTTPQQDFIYLHNPILMNHLQQPKGQADIEQKNTTTTEVKPVDEFPKEIIEGSVLPVELKPYDSTIPEPAIAASEKTEPLFTPYYTVDYFASLGIRLQQAAKPDNEFDRQLMSFTEWLKAIRKTPSATHIQFNTKPPDEKVEKMARHSLSESDIVTEAMAEIWIKQGEPEKAIAVYDKLSLQNPDKSAYFATLISNLKTH